jgi:RimJ/RimL family protein N-acetyltransferase
MIEWAFAEGVNRRRLAHWVADVIWPGKNREFGNCQGMAVIEDGELIAGIIYHNYAPDEGVIEISGAGTSKRWLTRQTLRRMFAYPFEECDCQSVVMRVSDHDKALHRMLKAYGFKKYRIPRLRGRDEAENVFVLTEEAWKSNKFNRVKRLS